ncbi:26S proteasome non-ATPase regulatory subunit 13 [Toxorhynchites rutilus septentrionalis]|uniref:26S proteasome non-ATPase regulatory subunit 13 n=1 Tax=Toxorhynchites rutilus septentrionalis TaxID=329112 RepID=UPI00247AE10E|nr:26S proteasome non-ATPase regulatory subunit 13 [Toxorhynchites rutilus septentrionalis]
MSANVATYLAEQKKSTDKELASEWTEIEELYNEKLWNELTIKLNTFVKNPALQNEDALLALYHKFISSFETKINPYGLVEILTVVISFISDKKEAVLFLDKLMEKVKVCDEAVWMCKVLQGQIYLEHLNELDATKKIIEDLKDILEEAGNVTPVHGKYYMLAANYYRLVGQHSDYYRCGLQFLGCSMDTYPKDQWSQQAFFLGLAALLGEGIYNIGELLAHPILESLNGSENEWLVELLRAFNSGDIIKFEQMKPKWSTIADLAAQEVKLRQKISLLCLMEMTFKRPANKRTITFEEIAKEAKLPIKEVEILIMKALAQGLVKGAIDEVAGVVNMTWVQPRVLDRKQVAAMATTLDTWMASITSMELLIESRASEILTN